MRRLAQTLILGALLGPVASRASAAELPPHSPLRILIIGDEVNPNGLSNAELTQPADIAAALSDPGNGINLAPGGDSVLGVDSQCIDAALAALADPNDRDVLVYFAHRAARSCADEDRQPELTAAVTAYLQAGGGVVVFHHGIYEAVGKQAILQLLGGTASSIQWSVDQGQNIINVAPDHFVTTQSVEYAAMFAYADPQSGVPAGDYPGFNNTPDERYPALALLSEPGESRTLLFASNYATNGSTHVLGYALERPGWAGRVVFYQSAEYQPQALDDLDGNNFQILANALVYAARAADDPGGDTDGTSTGAATGSDTGDPPGTTADPATTGNSPTTGEPPSGESTNNPTSITDPGESATATTAAEPGTSTVGSAGEPADNAQSSGGCGCRSREDAGPLALLLTLLSVPARRRARRG